MNSLLIQKVGYCFNGVTFNDFKEKGAEFLVSTTGGQDIVIYCKRSDIKTGNLFWGVQEKRILQPKTKNGITTHVLFYSEEENIFFIFDRIFIENKFSSQSFQEMHNGNQINKQYKYTAKKDSNQNNVWNFNFEKTNIIIPIIPFSF